MERGAGRWTDRWTGGQVEAWRVDGWMGGGTRGGRVSRWTTG